MKNTIFNYMFIKEVKKTDPNYQKYLKLAVESPSFVLHHKESTVYIYSTSNNCLVAEKSKIVSNNSTVDEVTLSLYLRAILPGDDLDD